MSFEEMTKPELVKEARTLSQEVKLLKHELEETKKLLAVDPDAVQVTVDMPYKAVSMVVGPRAAARTFVLEFNEAGDARVITDATRTFSAPYKALHAAEKVLNETISRQNKKETKEE